MSSQTEIIVQKFKTEDEFNNWFHSYKIRNYVIVGIEELEDEKVKYTIRKKKPKCCS